MYIFQIDVATLRIARVISVSTGRFSVRSILIKHQLVVSIAIILKIENGVEQQERLMLAGPGIAWGKLAGPVEATRKTHDTRKVGVVSNE